MGGATVGDGCSGSAAIGRIDRDGNAGRGVGDDDAAAHTADSQGGRRGIEAADAVHHNGEGGRGLRLAAAINGGDGVNVAGALFCRVGLSVSLNGRIVEPHAVAIYVESVGRALHEATFVGNIIEHEARLVQSHITQGEVAGIFGQG